MNTQSPHFPIWSAFVPKVVRERCPFCHGSGLREIGKGPLSKLEPCGACNAKGFTVAERIDVGAA